MIVSILMMQPSLTESFNVAFVAVELTSIGREFSQ
jgi:hypothetical protein